jgi:uracil-DNA glycosylase
LSAVAIGDLEARVRACRICVERPAGRPLPHEPRPVVRLSITAKVLIAGQAPGTKVHLSGVPFDDASGDRLRAWMGIDRETFDDRSRLAILPMGFCFPGQDAKGGDLPPRRECAPAWRAELLAAMPQIELVLAVGQYAHAWHLGALRGASLTETVTNWRSIFESAAHPRIMPMPHPSWRTLTWAKKNPWFDAELLPVLRGEVERLMKKS